MANLSNTDLSGAGLSTVDLTGANLRQSNLNGAYMFETNFQNADLNGADFSNSMLFQTNFGMVDLSKTIGLDQARHNGPSTVGIDTIYKSKGNIPESFLRGAGVPENFITYMHSLISKTFDYYSCFISYTERDDLFSERLYNDLQASGVRVWRWREDAPLGKTLMRSVDKAIRVYDKLIVICSEKSMQSPLVIREIERALQKEDEFAKKGMESEALFPIRLDDYIFEGWEHHRKADVIAKNVGDFRNWEDSKAYKKAFKRLLRDLQGKV